MRSLRVRHERPLWVLEVPLLIGGYIAFGLVRAAVDRGGPAATENALLVQRIERALKIDVELPLNQMVLAHPEAIYLTGYFYRLSVLAVPAVLIWLYLARRAHYRQLRTVLVVMTLLDLPLVLLYPEAPPRFSLPGIVDYMATYDILGGAQHRIPRPGINLLAAMPSMHVAWTTWCGYAVWSMLRHHRMAWLAWLFPLLTAFVVLVTGHHYVLDIVAGIALVAITVKATRWLSRRTQSTRPDISRT